MKRSTSLSLVVAAAALAALGTAGPAHAAARTIVADWEMNEPAGATTMLDSGPNRITGPIGTGLTTGVSFQGSTGYSWASTNPNQPPTKPERVIQVNDSRLNPGAADYAVTVRWRTTHSYGNVIQKGQNKTVGGYFKFEAPQGFMTCLFKGTAGQRAIKWPTATNDGAWHIVRCEKTAAGLMMTVDGVTKSAKGTIGSISNTVPMTIAGKINCDQVTVTCDYYAGGIDYIKIETAP
jgi:hypothetical protein